MFNSITEHLISSVCHSPWSHSKLWSTNQGRAVHAATTATAAAHALGKVGNIHPRMVGTASVPRSGNVERTDFLHMSRINVWERWRMLQPPWWSTGTSPECEHPHLSTPFQQDPLLSISEQLQVPIHGAKAMKIPAAAGDWICTM